MAKKGASAVVEQIGLMDHVDDIDDEVYTVDTERRVRRRRSVGNRGDDAGIEPRDHGIVTLGSLKRNVVEVENLFEIVMIKLLVGSSPSRKMQLKVLSKEMDLRIEKLVRNLKQMETDEARDQEIEKHMKIVEESHADDLPSDYMR